MPYERFDAEERILRDELALDRTRLANERTILAYLCTGLMLLATGATAVKLAFDDRAFVFAGWGFIVLGTVVDDKPGLMAMVTPDLTRRGIRAGDIIRAAAVHIDGRGGGRPELAEAGGTNAAGLDAALASVEATVRSLAGVEGAVAR